MAGYTRQDIANDIANNKVIDADDLDEEFDALETAFNEVSGHKHDGTVGEGVPITVIGPNQEIIASVSALYPNADNTLDLGTSGAEFKDLFLDGTANIDSLVADTADIDGGTIDGTIIGGTNPAAATVTDLTASGTVDIDAGTIDGVTIGTNSAATEVQIDNININGNSITSTDTDGNIDLTPNGTGEVNISKIDIDAGTIDGVTIGTNSAATEVQIDNININGNAITSTDTDGNIDLTPDGTGEVNISKVDIDAGTIDGITLGTNSAVTEAQVDNININGNSITSTDVNGNIDLTPNGTGEVNISKVDIDAGTIDGVTIGGASAGAVTTTDLTSTGTVDLTSATVNLGAGAVDAITEIDSALKSGSDATIITGTAGTDGDLSVWNADGDLVDGPTPPSGTIVGTNDTQTLVNKTIDSANNTLTVDLGEATVTGTTAQFNTALSDDDFVTLGGTETITGNKTFSGTINPSGDVAGDVNPSTNSTYDLGSSSKAWAEVHADKVLTDTFEDRSASKSIDAVYVTDGTAKAWANLVGTGTIALNDSLNVSSITDNGVGYYTVTYTNAFTGAYDKTRQWTTAVTAGFTVTNSSNALSPPTASTDTGRTGRVATDAAVDSTLVDLITNGDLA